MILKDTIDEKVEIKDGLVFKYFKNVKKTYNDFWQHHYNRFQIQYGIMPKLYECKDNLLIMEYITGKTCKRDEFQMHEFIYQQHKIQMAFVEYSYNNKITFFHRDLTDSNIRITPDGEWKIIEPDALDISKQLHQYSYYNMVSKPLGMTVDMVQWHVDT